MEPAQDETENSSSVSADQTNASTIAAPGEPLDPVTNDSERDLSKYEYIVSQEFVDAFWSLVKKRPGDDCWQWMGGLHRQGFGRFTTCGKDLSAHRVAWELENGPIASNRTLMPDPVRCNNRGCVRPDHHVLGFQGRSKKKKRIPKDPVLESADILPTMFHVKHLDAVAGVKVFMDPQERPLSSAEMMRHVRVIKSGLATLIKRQGEHTDALQVVVGQLVDPNSSDRTLRALVQALADHASRADDSHRQALDGIAALLLRPPPTAMTPHELRASPPKQDPLEQALVAMYREKVGLDEIVPVDPRPLVKANTLALEHGKAPDAAAVILGKWIAQFAKTITSADPFERRSHQFWTWLLDTFSP